MECTRYTGRMWKAVIFSWTKVNLSLWEWPHYHWPFHRFWIQSLKLQQCRRPWPHRFVRPSGFVLIYGPGSAPFFHPAFGVPKTCNVSLSLINYKNKTETDKNLRRTWNKSLDWSDSSRCSRWWFASWLSVDLLRRTLLWFALYQGSQYRIIKISCCISKTFKFFFKEKRSSSNLVWHPSFYGFFSNFSWCCGNDGLLLNWFLHNWIKIGLRRFRLAFTRRIEDNRELEYFIII